jgi:pimeloyl-ACP methyl ester carboxylesterase
MKTLVLVFAALLLAALGASAGPPPKYFVDESKLPFEQGLGGASTRLWGVLNGAGYRIEVPESNWNGSLVMWAHGFRGDGLELTFTDDDPPEEMRAFLIANGFAWAASTYSKNRYDPAQGAKDTHALAEYFRDNVATPRRIYIVGASMGGHVVAVMAEQWPHAYDAAMPVCGVLGDYELFDYFLDFNLAAQTLSGIGARFPFAADYLSATVPATKAALGPGFPAFLNPAGENFRSLVELRSGGVRPLFDQGFLFWNSPQLGDFLFGLGLGDGTLPRQPGVAVQNSDVEYHFDADPALTPDERAFNEDIQRITADRQARRIDGIANVPPTTGDLRIPMLTLHTLGDLFVPFHMEQEYARRVAAHAGSHLLVQRATRDFGHCSFTPIELGTAFTDLVGWVEFGVKPAGDNVLDPDVVADPNYGCTFTDKASPRFWDGPGLGFLKPDDCPAP